MRFHRNHQKRIALGLLSTVLLGCQLNDRDWVIGDWVIDVAETERHFEKPELTVHLDFQKSVPELAEVLTLGVTTETISIENAKDSGSRLLNYTVDDEPFRMMVSNPGELKSLEIVFTREADYLVQEQVYQYGNINVGFKYYWRRRQ